MQLPRGTFREIRKGENIDSLLLDLEKTRFSGIASLSSEGGTGTLVFKGGKCILVKYLGKTGDAGWDELQNNIGKEVDAALSSLDDAQIQLSLEFNKTCRLLRTQKPGSDQKRVPANQAHEQARKPAPPIHTASSAAIKAPQKPSAAAALFQRHPRPAEESPDVAEQEPRKAATGFGRPAMPAPPAAQQQSPSKVPSPVKSPGAAESPEGAGQASIFEKDIDTFDSMDLDNVTDKIRNDCKTMIKQLHLEHLMER